MTTQTGRPGTSTKNTSPPSHRLLYDFEAITSAPLRIEAVVRLDAPAERVFAKVGDLTGVGSFFPLIRWAKVDHSQSRTAGNVDVGCIRTCSVTGMGTLHERIVLWDPPHGYAYTASGKFLPLRDHLAVIFVEPDNSGGSVLIWRHYFRTKWAPLGTMAPVMMSRMMEQAFTNLRKEFGGLPAQVRRVR